jgi:hypothetical protein
VKKIPLTKNKFALVDDEDYSVLIEHSWHTIATKNHFYAARRQGKNGPYIYMHRFLLGLMPGDSRHVDHVNCNGLDNRRHNIRIITPQNNIRRKRKTTKSKSSKFKGVSWKQSHNKWEAFISLPKQHLFLGYFDSAKEAALAYDKAAKHHFGEFACLNFP